MEKFQETWCAFDDVMRSLVERASNDRVRSDMARGVKAGPAVQSTRSKRAEPALRHQVSEHQFRVEKQAA